ncbi:MAG: transcription antitermination factor NusB [Cytophagaceae bacterium]|nr:transcription antitermination factor NusB [Cytophagaceae bacterium]MBK9511755.1 transcription antitermination factor NusB [Cytophagaceae bacterium]MBK9934213.1 transcription antitermination factor NusB [Cytophagaceae bacterium]MBL0300662.1 transcription antitermination factor NusB [Cytophagaceae bacterium]MBL0327604.1 transcription antitermination factor NusB [Cytophagaceae bacterium]
MLNRRLVRIRVMQALYAFEKAKAANFLLANDFIAESFAPDLNSMEKQDRNKLQGLQKLTQSIFQDEIKSKIFTEDSGLPSTVKLALANAREMYRLKNKKDIEFFSLQIVLDAEKVYDLYIYLLALLLEIAPRFEGGSAMSKNKVLAALKASKELEHQMLKRSINWENERAFVSRIYNETLKNNPHILEYSGKVNHSSEEDTAVLKYIIKNIFLKKEECAEFFEKMHIYWVEDTEILRTMLFHSIQGFPDTGNVEIEKLDELWDDTKDFLKTLFKTTVDQDDELQAHLVPFLKNWEIDRIIETDRILLKMAVSELINFPSVPVKVTINEIIDISKSYSSAKSGNFVNGILDSVVKDLQAKKILKKSGRGMIDNK